MKVLLPLSPVPKKEDGEKRLVSRQLKEAYKRIQAIADRTVSGEQNKEKKD